MNTCLHLCVLGLLVVVVYMCLASAERSRAVRDAESAETSADAVGAGCGAAGGDAPAAANTVRRRRRRSVRFRSLGRPTTKMFRKNAEGIPTIATGKKTALYIKWTKCGICLAFDEAWDAFAADRASAEPGADVLTLTFEAGDADADALVRWFMDTPVFDGAFPTVLGFAEGGAGAVVHRGPRDANALRAWFEAI